MLVAAEKRLGGLLGPAAAMRSPAWGPHLHRWGAAFPDAPLLPEGRAVVPSARVAFCGDFASRKFQDYALIVVNQEEVMGELEPWLESKTLGVASACFSTSHNVVEGVNVVGFRVVSGDLSLALTHLVWT